MYKYLSILIIFLMSCEISNQEKITDEEVKEKFHEFFDILSVPFLMLVSVKIILHL